eukprot:gene9692-10682_t
MKIRSGRRSKFSQENIMTLTEFFKKCSNPGQKEREKLSIKTGLDEEKVRVWFQNARARSRAQRNLQQQPHASSSQRCKTKIRVESRQKTALSQTFGTENNDLEESNQNVHGLLKLCSHIIKESSKVVIADEIQIQFSEDFQANILIESVKSILEKNYFTRL